MHLCHVDEAGTTGKNLQDPQQPVFAMAGLLVSDEKWRKTDSEIRNVIAKAHGGPPPQDFELHASSLRGTAGTEFFARARERGWFECVWEKLGEEVQTWFRPGDRPYQLDHAFCDPALGDRLQTARVAADAATDLRLSDHAPLILDFDVAPISMTGLTAQP